MAEAVQNTNLKTFQKIKNKTKKGQHISAKNLFRQQCPVLFCL